MPEPKGYSGSRPKSGAVVRDHYNERDANTSDEWFTVPDLKGLRLPNPDRRDGQSRNLALKLVRLFDPKASLALDAVTAWKRMMEVSNPPLPAVLYQR